jgi:hypothetical protein
MPDSEGCPQCGARSLDVSSAPYPEALFSNIEPPAPQIPILRDALDDTEAKNLAIDEQIERLRAHRTRLHELAAVQKGTLSPARRVPNEVLVDIFLFATQETTSDLGFWRLHPWSPSKVCRRWRATAVSSPRFWNEIDIRQSDCERSGPDSHNSLLSLVPSCSSSPGTFT